jgi:hypothetical protein
MHEALGSIPSTTKKKKKSRGLELEFVNLLSLREVGWRKGEERKGGSSDGEKALYQSI